MLEYPEKGGKLMKTGITPKSKFIHYCKYDKEQYELEYSYIKSAVVLRNERGNPILTISLQTNEFIKYFIQVADNEFAYTSTMVWEKGNPTSKFIHLKIDDEGVQVLNSAVLNKDQIHDFFLTDDNATFIHTLANGLFIYNTKQRKSFQIVHSIIDACYTEVNDSEEKYPLINVELDIPATEYEAEETREKDTIIFYINGFTMETTNLYSMLEEREIPIITSEEPLENRMMETLEQEVLKYLNFLSLGNEKERVQNVERIEQQLIKKLKREKYGNS